MLYLPEVLYLLQMFDLPEMLYSLEMVYLPHMPYLRLISAALCT